MLTLGAINAPSIAGGWFFAHGVFDRYRKLGVDQFITLDNLSTYGTAERLRAKADCVAISSDQRYIEEHLSCLRTDIQWKPQIPQIFCKEHWSLCVDADELVFKPGFGMLCKRRGP
jgi:hypothetical protein